MNAFSRFFSGLFSAWRVERSAAGMAVRVLLPWCAITACARRIFVIMMSAQIRNELGR